MNAVRLMKYSFVICIVLFIVALFLAERAFSQEWILKPGAAVQVKCEPCPECKPCPTNPPATPPPTLPPATPKPSAPPTAAPTPTPTATPAVCPSGGSTVTMGALQAALDAAPANATICVLDGLHKGPVYIRKPVRLMAAPGAKPIIEPGLSADNNGKVWIYVPAKGYIIEGFEIRYGHEGIKSYASNGIIRNNYVHHNRVSNINIATESAPVDNVTVQGNRIEWPGYDANNKPYPGVSNKQAHGLYFSDFTCLGITNIYAIQNTFYKLGGRMIQGNAESCTSKGGIRNGLFSNNTGLDVSFGIIFWGNVQNIIARENNINTYNYPQTNDPDHFCFGFYQSNGNTIENNTCKVSMLGNTGGGCGNNHYGTFSNIYRGNICTR